jgi:UDP-N-acetylmuramoyl-tripeptide--D-alanyl-D-alanine ligase
LGFISNLYAAITIGKYFEVDENSIKEALESYIPENNRSQLLTKGSNKIILVAGSFYFILQGLNKILILGICLN